MLEFLTIQIGILSLFDISFPVEKNNMLILFFTLICLIPKLLKAKIDISNDHAKVRILEKETGISPGQACVFYSKDEHGDKVLGGGWIDRTFNNNLST